MHRPLVLLLLLSLSLFCSAKQVRSQFLSTSSVSQLKQISTLGKGSSVHLSNLTVAGSQSLLKPLLVPRVAGTQGNKNVQKFILDFLENLNFSIEQDPFEDDTPEGRKSLYVNQSCFMLLTVYTV